jgi:hypothetical protein
MEYMVIPNKLRTDLLPSPPKSFGQATPTTLLR